MNEMWTVTVEWMDGQERKYTVGGYCSRREAIAEGDGILVLRMGNSQFGAPEHQATIPLANLRQYRVV